MEKNTKLDEVLFPVGFANVLIEGKIEGEYSQKVGIPIDKYQALINMSTGDVLSVVTKDYKLITNKQAIEFGKECYKQVFNINNIDNFEVFNVISPSTKSFCHIDVIMKDHQINLLKQEIYFPFIRITNSYNKTKKAIF